MSDSPAKAVFLSYASQDAEAAKRIADALRTAGVEVWFDQSELRGGDSWDAKIRRQIKECALFVPIISPNTNSRPEGYFRLEWKLAVDRSHLLADDHPFLFPIVIGDVADAMARVPDKFRDVQWTRLRLDETPVELAARITKLLTGGLEMEPGRPRPGMESRGGVAAPPGRMSHRPAWLRYSWAAVGILFGLIYAIRPLFQSTRPREARPPAAAPPAEVRQFVAKVWEQLNKPELARAQLETADGFGRRATELDPNDASAWAAWSQVDSWTIYHNFDASPARREAARTKAARAMQLAPDSYEARLAQACYLVRGQAGGDATLSLYAGEAEKLLRVLLKEKRDEPRALFTLGILLRNTGAFPECREIFKHLADNPAFTALAWNELGWAEYIAEDYTAAGIAIDKSIALQAYWGNLTLKEVLAQWWLGDLDRAKAAQDRMPVTALQEDIGVYMAVGLAHWRREPEIMLQILSGVPRDWLQSNGFTGPTAWYAALAHQMAGREAAAQVQWRTALAAVERRLAGQPDSGLLLHWKGTLLAASGSGVAADPVLRLAREMRSKSSSVADAMDQVLLGNLDAAMTLLERAVDERSRFVTVASYRLNPTWDPLRDQPRFHALLARMEADPRFSPKANEAPAAVADQKSVAVLSFANLSDDKANEYFSDGISEELLTVLQKIPGLRVAARTSAFSFKGRSATAQEIGEKLGVANLVEGSVRKAGNSVRITARLSRAATGEQVWSESYTRDLKDVFAVQSELAQTIVGQLRGQLGVAAKAEIEAQVQAAEKGGTQNPEAHELYLQGKYFLGRATLDDTARATTLLQRAVELDPSFALAWAALSGAGWFRGGYGNNRQDFDEGYALARRAADRAIALEPALAAGHISRFDLQASIDFDWKGSLESLRRAQALAPSDPAVVFRAAQLAYSFGQEERAMELIRQAVALDPVNPIVYVNQGYIFLSARRFAEAEAAFRHIIDISPTAPWAYAGVGMSLVARGQSDQAVAAAEQESPEFSRLYVLSLARWGQKKRTEADAVLAEFIKKDADVAAYQIATVYSYRGDPDRAFEWLERAYRQRDPGLSWAKPDFFLQPLHADPRWGAFMHQLGLADDQLK